MKTKTKINNIELQLGTLQQERAQEAKKLTSVIKERDKVLLYISNKIDDIERLKAKIEVLNGKVKIEKEATKKEILKRKGVIKSAKNELKEIRVDKNKELKKLEGLNFRIMNAEKQIDDLIEIKGGYEITQEQVDKLKKLEESVKERASKIGKDNIKLKKENELLSINNSKIVKGFNKTVDNKQKQMETLDIKIAKAKNQLDKLVIDSRRIRQDCDIYVERAEKKYSKVFPKLKMNLI